MKRPSNALIPILLMPLLWAAPAAAQTTDNATEAISEAVRSGETPYRPLPAGPANAGDAESAECQSLRERIAVAPKREYHADGPMIEDSQGRSFPGLTRERPRKELEQAYRDNCLR